MRIIDTKLAGVKIIEPDVFEDFRGMFMETYHRERYHQQGIDIQFVQDNLSCSVKGSLRGLHYQHPHSQAKLVQAASGEIWDVAVDIRPNSPTFGEWASAVLSGENRRQLLIPGGFAHGFCVTSESALVFYKCSDFYLAGAEAGILWCDPDLGIEWPVEDPVLSAKDMAAPRLKDIPMERLPG